MEVGSRRKDHVSIDMVNEEDVLLSSITQKMEAISLSHCLTRVPEQLSKGCEEKYFPSLVSIGPFHHGKPTLNLMNHQKLLYLNSLLSRKPNQEATLHSCIQTLRQLQPKARKFYDETLEMGSDQFLEILLLDGCFVIELFLAHYMKDLRRRDDPCFATSEGLFRLRCDIMLFENQLPFFILDHLFHLVPIPQNCHLSLIDLSLHFFKKLIPNHPQIPHQISSPQTHHLLDLIRQNYLPTTPQYLPAPPSQGHAHIAQATRLIHEFGIIIERTISESPSNITFFNGKLNIPTLEISTSYTEILFRNLIAMEQCHPGCSKHVSSYVAMIEQLARFKRDVRLLQDREILIDGHGREVEIALLFKMLKVDVNVKDFYYRGICEQVSGFQRRKRDVCWVKMRDLYHRSNLGIAGFSLVVLVLVFLFTAAFFSAVNYLLHHYN